MTNVSSSNLVRFASSKNKRNESRVTKENRDERPDYIYLI